MRRVISIYFFVWLTWCSMGAQVTTVSGYKCSRQSQADSFLILYPDATRITNHLEITRDVVSLAAFKNIKSIGGEIRIRDRSILENFVGLDNLEICEGGIVFSSKANNKIKNFKGLEKLKRSDNIACSSSFLESLEGLKSLKRLTSGFSVRGCSRLKNLRGLEALDTIANEDYKDNLSLNFFQVIDCDSITSLEGVENLKFANHIIIENNKSLTDISALRNKDMINETNNNARLVIINNPKLTSCAVAPVCGYLIRVARDTQLYSPPDILYYNQEIYNNGPDCSSIEQVKQTCLSSTTSDTEFVAYRLVPNPGSDEVTIDGSEVEGLRLYVSDLYGRSMPVTVVGGRIATAQWSAGIYVFRWLDAHQRIKQVLRWVKM